MTQTQLADAVNKKMAEAREGRLLGLLTQGIVSLGAEKTKETVISLIAPSDVELATHCCNRIDQIVEYLEQHPDPAAQ